MGCCCQLELIKMPQVDLESISSEPIKILTQNMNRSNSLKLLTEEANKDNNGSFSERNDLNNIIDVINEHTIILQSNSKYPKALSDYSKQKKYIVKRLETVKETNRDISYKKSNSGCQHNSIRSSFHQSKGKQLSIDTIKITLEISNDNYNSKLAEIKRLFTIEKHEDQSINIINQKYDYHSNTNPLNQHCFLENPMIDINTKVMNISNIKENQISNHDKLIQQFTKVTNEENNQMTKKKKYSRSLTKVER